MRHVGIGLLLVVSGLAACGTRHDEGSVDEQLQRCVNSAAGQQIDLGTAATDPGLADQVRRCFDQQSESFDDYLLKLADAEAIIAQLNVDRRSCFSDLGWTAPADENWANPVIFGASIPASQRERFADDYVQCMSIPPDAAASMRGLVVSATEEDAEFQREMNTADLDGDVHDHEAD